MKKSDKETKQRKREIFFQFFIYLYFFILFFFLGDKHGKTISLGLKLFRWLWLSLFLNLFSRFMAALRVYVAVHPPPQQYLPPTKILFAVVLVQLLNCPFGPFHSSFLFCAVRWTFLTFETSEIVLDPTFSVRRVNLTNITKFLS